MPAAAPARSRSKRRGVARSVVAIDLSPTLIDLARERAPRELGAGSVEFRVGDMLDPALGRFDHVVAMDSLIHYRAGDVVRALSPASARARSARCCSRSRRARPALARDARRRAAVPARRPRAGDRAGTPRQALRQLDRREPRLGAWRARAHAAGSRSGFYMSQALELDPRDEAAQRHVSRADWTHARPALPAVRRRGDGRTAARAACCACRCSRCRSAWRVVLLIGTLNRVMIVELGVPAWLVAVMVSLPLVFAPFRALVGFRSDTHRSALGWRRVPVYLDGHAAAVRRACDHAVRAASCCRAIRTGPSSSARSARRSRSCWSAPGCTRRRPPASRWQPTLRRRQSRPRVVALLYVMLLLGMVGERARASARCSRISAQLRLIQVIQGAALVTMVLNVVALWKQEARDPSPHRARAASADFSRSVASVSPRTAERRRAVRGGGARHRRVQHAGHPAGALRRADPAPLRRRDDDR